MTVSRRSLFALGAAAAAAVVAGCSRSVRSIASSSAVYPPVSSTSRSSARPAQTAAPTPSAAAPSSVPSSAPSSAQSSSHSSDPASRPTGAAAIEYGSGPRGRPQLALTFHGAGDPAIARDLLAIFAAHRARLTVLAVGTWLVDYPQIAHEIVAAGHELGNHTYSHLDIDSLSAAAAQAEIVRCRDLLVTLVGSGGRHFRPSQAQHATPLVRQLAGAAGYPSCLSYDVDSLDYTDPGAGAIRRNVAIARAGSIVSLHFGHPGTVLAMPQILTDLTSRGLQAVTATELLAS